MKLIYFIGYLFPILMMDAVSRKVDNTKIASYPINFDYKFGDKLTIEIALKNKPMGVNYYLIYNANFDTICEGPFAYSEDSKIDVSYSLMSLKDVIYIGLFKYDVVCTTKRIWSGNATGVISGMCTYGRQRCTIEVNLKNKCDGESFKIKCYMYKSDYICKSSHLISTPANTIHNWYQASTDNNDNIGIIPTTTASKTKLIIKLEHFDMHTSINSVIEFQGDILYSNINFIGYTRNSIQDDKITIFKYSDSEDYLFTCKEYLNRTSHVQVVYYNKRKNKIRTYNDFFTILKENFSKTLNGGILCCVYYLVSGTDYEKTILRVVEKKSLLIYTNETIYPNAATPHLSYNSILFIAAAVIGTFCIILIIIIIILMRKLYSKSSKPEESLELETFTPQNNTAIYANMDYHCGRHQLRNSLEESHYATIVGVLKQSGQEKKKSIK